MNCFISFARVPNFDVMDSPEDSLIPQTGLVMFPGLRHQPLAPELLPVSGSSRTGVATSDRVKLSSVIGSSKGGTLVDASSCISSTSDSAGSGGFASGGTVCELPGAAAFSHPVSLLAFSCENAGRPSASFWWPCCPNRSLKVWIPRA